MRVREISARSVLNRSKIFDYCLNPYTGCEINCRYCYARLFMGRYSGHSEPWGTFVDVKVNAPAVLEKQIGKAKKGTVWISSVCDPYQPLEKGYSLTRRCLEVLADRQFPVNVQTKSVLLLRDLDLFQAFETIEVGMTVTTDDEKTAALFEPGASSVKERLTALERLRTLGIRTFAFIGPLLPGDPQRLVAGLEQGADRVLIDRMNYMGAIKGFYRRRGLAGAAEEEFFEVQRDRLVSELIRRNIPYEALF